MRHLGIIVALACWIAPVDLLAQAVPPVESQDQQSAPDTTEDERGYLQAFLEDNLSSAGREVRIIGLTGALSSEATIDSLSIADDDGVWITLSDVVLDWRRAALLAGRLEVDKLSAKTIDLARLPVTPEGLTPERSVATTFSLPELPVSVSIGEISAETVLLGEPILGTPVELTLTGSMTLAGGEGASKLEIERTDAPGSFLLDAAYSNATDILTLDLALEEQPGGIATTLLNLPDSPALSLTINGTGPLSDYTAEISLETDDKPRLTGEVTIAEVARDPDQPADPSEGSARRFTATLEGDLTPLLAAEHRRFFGPDSGLEVSGVRAADGALDISTLSLSAAALSLDGSLSLTPDGWPRQFQLQGTLGDGTRLLLPTPDADTWITSAKVSAGFNAAAGSEWQANLSFDGLEQGPFTIDKGALLANGVIAPDAVDAVSALVSFAVEGLNHTDPALARAMGSAVNGVTAVKWGKSSPLELRNMDLRAGDVRLTGGVLMEGLENGFPTTANVRLVTADLSRFAPLLDRPLAGSADARINGNGTLLGGMFDVTLKARTRDLVLDIPRLDPLLRGTSVLEMTARRDTVGTTLDRLDVRNDAATIAATGFTDDTGGRATLSATLTDMALVEPKLPGKATVSTDAVWQFGGDVTVNSLTLTLADAVVNANGTVSTGDAGLPVRGQVSGQIGDLSRFAALAGMRLAGQVDLALEGSGQIEAQTFDITTDLNGSGLRTGIAELDKLLSGQLSLSAQAGRTKDAIDIRRIALSSGQMELTALAISDAVGAPLNITARLANLGLFAPDFKGPISATGTVNLIGPDARQITVDLNAQGPGGTTARVAGDILEQGARMNLSAVGTAPLGLANSFIAPQLLQGTASYDLRVDGAPGLSALSGSLRTTDARLAMPGVGLAIEQGNGTVDLSSGRANIDFAGQFRDGGSLRVNGPVTLSAPFNGDLTAVVANMTLTDNLIYTTTVDGTLTMAGPLTGGAKIGGTVTMGKTEVRIPSSTAASSVLFDDLKHVGEPARVTRTRRFAGLIKAEGTKTSRPYPLDIQINAPNRLFVRGRGLDAELGGKIRVTGTTHDVVPSGYFQLIRGRLDILGKRLTLTEGLVDLRGALDPYLKFVAETDVDETTVQIIVEGLASEIEITFQSQPELPQEEVVSLLLLGRSLDQISPFQAAQLASAVATLAGRGGDGVVGNLRKAVGLSDLDVTQTDDGATEVSAGAYISEKVYSEVSADSDGRQEINLNLDLSRSVTVKGGVSNDGGTGIGIYFEKDY
ncbi:translocation/assembly module TamB domain-containing protein [Rhodobacteraceae bacterium KMM 6894]|nr:translocation/assembly module TamB domain-containing protein [Rhodobacteraceae bacterium KMM 6894]